MPAKEINLITYKQALKDSLKQATICLLVKDNEVLLAMKKRGLGEGKWNGPGGKRNKGEKIKSAAIRETREEVGMTPKKLQKVATLNFYFPNNPSWSQQVLVYKTTSWDGEPMETEEMAPRWFFKDQIPYESMWEDDKHWLPLVLEDKIVEADFLFEDNEKISEYEITVF